MMHCGILFERKRLFEISCVWIFSLYILQTQYPKTKVTQLYSSTLRTTCRVRTAWEKHSNISRNSHNQPIKTLWVFKRFWILLSLWYLQKWRPNPNCFLWRKQVILPRSMILSLYLEGRGKVQSKPSTVPMRLVTPEFLAESFAHVAKTEVAAQKVVDNQRIPLYIIRIGCQQHSHLAILD